MTDYSYEVLIRTAANEICVVLGSVSSAGKKKPAIGYEVENLRRSINGRYTTEEFNAAAEEGLRNYDAFMYLVGKKEAETAVIPYNFDTSPPFKLTANYQALRRH